MRRWLLSLALFLLLVSTGAAQSLGYGPVSLQNPLNLQHPQTRGLVTMWHVLPGLDGGKTWYDLRQRWPVTLVNMTTPGSSGYAGTSRPGGLGEIRFDGSNDYGIATGSSAALAFADATFTIAGWLKTASLATQQFVLAEQLGTSGQGGWLLRLETTGLLQARILDSTNSNSARRSSSSTLVVNTWYHVAVVYTTNTATQAGNTVTLYLNGLLDQGSQTDGANPYAVCGCDVIVGIQGDQTSSPFSGALDDLRIYNYGLSAQEVQQVYDLGRRGSPGLLQRFAPGLLVSTTTTPSDSFFSFFP